MWNYWMDTKVPILNGWGVRLNIPPSSTKVKNEWSYTSTPLLCLRGIEREKVHFLYLSNFK